MLGYLETPLGRVPRVGSDLGRADRLGGCKVRWGIGRYDYTVVPGLYALGRPDADSPVLVTANYKLSFDALRRELKGLDVWLLPVDTNGINVWCAAGKRTFGTQTVVQAVQALGLERLVNHRRLVLPQLAAPGVAAHLVKRHTGFEVKWGPIRADQVPAFLAAGYKAGPDMRRKDFPLRERAALAPMELVPALKYGLPLAGLVMLLAGLVARGSFWQGALGPGLFLAGAMLWATVAGSLAGPLLLPWLPGRAFALKGAGLGLAAASVYLAPLGLGPLMGTAGFLVVLAMCSFVVMNFTGSSTYTSLSGVKKEMRRAVPLQVVAMLIGLGLWVWGLLA